MTLRLRASSLSHRAVRLLAVIFHLSLALMPTSVVSEIQEPSSTRPSSHTPPLPIVDPTCAALAKLAADVKFFNNCTSVTTKPCDAIFCSGGEHQYQASMILLLCNVPKAILLMLGNEKKVILQATVNHTEEIPVPELDLVLNITLDQFPLAIGLKIDAKLSTTTQTIVEYTVIPWDLSTCVTNKEEDPR